jgi:hypothetical protein
MNNPGQGIFPAEARLVLLSACGEWADARILEILEEPLDWGSVLALATREHACASAAARFARLGIPTAAAGAFEALRQQGMVEEFRMELLEERLDRLMARFRADGVEFVLLKGAAVALRYLGGLKARPMGDLDVLVRAERASVAHELALELGWVPRKGLHDELYVGMPHLPPLIAGDGLGFGLEVHTALFPDDAPFRFSPEDVWRSAVPLPRLGAPLVPAPEHLFLHACLHFAWSHRFRRGAWRTVRDLDALIADPLLRLDELAELVTDARGQTCIYWTCALVEEITGRAPLVSPAPGPQITRGVRHDWILRHLLLEAAYAPDGPGTRRLGRLLWSLAVRPRASGHGAARPWKGEERWGDLGHDGQPGGWAERLSGFTGYAAAVLGLSPLEPPAA